VTGRIRLPRGVHTTRRIRSPLVCPISTNRSLAFTIELRFQREKSIGKTLLHFFTRNFMLQNMLDIVEIPVKTLNGHVATVNT